MRLLGIETSCDETAVCILDASGTFDKDFKATVLGNTLLSQIETHRPYGGVFPNVARREHTKNLLPVLTETLKSANLLKEKYSDISHYRREDIEKILAREPELCKQLLPFLKTHGNPNIDAISVTVGPGLEPALWVGINFARALATAWSTKRQTPLVPVNHMEGHIIMSLVEKSEIANVFTLRKCTFPAVVLLISGGHTELLLMRDFGVYELLGQTRDDAAGEAFDKIARLLGLPYPGGPEISTLAEEARSRNLSPRMALPRPMLRENTFDFSFSGLKTAARRLIEAHTPLSDDTKREIALECENAITDVLVAKTARALETYGAKTLIVGGGVSANTHIRSQFEETLEGRATNILVCPPEFSGDNALMIALAGYFRALKKDIPSPETLAAQGNLSLY